MAEPVVDITEDLKNQLGSKVANDYIEAFEQWQRAGGGLFDHRWFGWDNPYERPPPTDKNAGWTLYHVHLEPAKPLAHDYVGANDAFEAARKTYDRWMSSKAKQRWRPTSDDVLVYARDMHGVTPRFLLIDILTSPNAHKIAEMTTADDKMQMLAYLDVAEQYVYFGKIIV